MDYNPGFDHCDMEWNLVILWGAYLQKLDVVLSDSSGNHESENQASGNHESRDNVRRNHDSGNHISGNPISRNQFSGNHLMETMLVETTLAGNKLTENILAETILDVNRVSTVKDLLHSIKIRYFGGDINIIATFTINTKYYLMHFYLFKIAVSIAFHCENAVEAI